jgi:thiamine biosynthesis protein ThiS
LSENTQTVKIVLNGKEREIQTGATVQDLLTKWRMRPELVTVELNETILQKLDYETTKIKAGDHVEFIFYMGGGERFL